MDYYSPWSEREIWLFLKVEVYLQNRKSHTHQNWCKCMLHLPLLTWIFWAEKGNLAGFESSGISENGEASPTKIGVHALLIHPYLHEFFEALNLKWSQFIYSKYVFYLLTVVIPLIYYNYIIIDTVKVNAHLIVTIDGSYATNA